MEEKYTYSFIIPHKNCPGLLNRCIDSIPERDDVQIIVVDDNSEEGKKPSLKGRKNLHVILLDAEHSKGAGRARNVGLAKAEGKWLLFADSDDYYVEGFLDVLDIYRNMGIDVLFFNFVFKDGKTGEILPSLWFQKYFTEYDGSREAKDQVKFHHNVPWTKMVSHNYVKEHNLYFEEVPNGNDILFSMMVGYYTDNIAVERKALYVYLRNEESILTSRENEYSALCRLTHLIKLKKFYKFIGHAEWGESVFKRVMYKIYTLGLPFFALVIRESLSLYRTRYEWVYIMQNNQKVSYE